MQISSRRCDFGEDDGETSETCNRWAQVVSFSFQHQRFRVDLCPRHEEALIERMEPFVIAATRQPGRASQVHVRTWLKDHGYEVAGRGVIPEHLMTAYLKETQSEAGQ